MGTKNSTKLILNQILLYYPHKLKGVVNGVSVELKGIHYNAMQNLIGSYEINNVIFEKPLIEFKPILRPHTELLNFIEVKGKEIQPLKTLYKMFVFQPIKQNTIITSTVYDNYTEYRLHTSNISPHSADYVLFVLEFHNSGSFNCFAQIQGEKRLFINTIKIYKQLHEWYFDTEQLIPSQLALDINLNN